MIIGCNDTLQTSNAVANESAEEESLAISAVELNPYIMIVKNGYFENRKSLSVGEVFDNYRGYSDTSWEYFVSDNGQNVVQLTGTFVPEMAKNICHLCESNTETYNECNERVSNLHSIKHVVQFLINHDNTFEVSYFGVQYETIDGKIAVDSIISLDKLFASLYANNLIYETNGFQSANSDEQCGVGNYIALMYNTQIQHAK